MIVVDVYGDVENLLFSGVDVVVVDLVVVMVGSGDVVIFMIFDVL